MKTGDPLGHRFFYFQALFGELSFSKTGILSGIGELSQSG